MAFAVKYYRDHESVRRWKAHGIIKPVGFAVTSVRYATHLEAQAEADAINRCGPVQPACVVPAKAASTVRTGKYKGVGERRKVPR